MFSVRKEWFIPSRFRLSNIAVDLIGCAARALCFLAAALLAGAFTAAADAQTRRFPFGYSSFSANQTALWTAKDEGFFKRFGLDPDLILIEGGTRGAQALISGDLPIMAMSGQPVISARARGSDLTMIAGMVNKMNYVLI